MVRLVHENLRLRELALSDPLTGLDNLRSFRARLEEAVGRGGPLVVVMIDLDGMKRLNDTCGHAAGDEGLRRVADALREEVRGAGVAARLGGDEFALLLHATVPGAIRATERIRARIAAAAVDGALDGAPRLSASFGMAELDGALARDGSAAAEELLGRADGALYGAKRAGKNRVELHVVGGRRAA